MARWNELYPSVRRIEGALTLLSEMDIAFQNPSLNFHRTGSGKPLVLFHGLGGNIASWHGLLPALAGEREVIAVDLPGHGASPTSPDAGTFQGVADGAVDFIQHHKLAGVDVAGFSLGGRVVLDLARRGLVGSTVALAPGGFWNARERRLLKASLFASAKLVRSVRGALPFLTRHKATRVGLLAQLSARPGQVPPELALQELRSLISTPNFEALVRDLAEGPAQAGSRETPGPVTIVWGRKDRLLLPRQAEQAVAEFHHAQLHWVANCGHYIIWDAPDEARRLILEGTR